MMRPLPNLVVGRPVLFNAADGLEAQEHSLYLFFVLWTQHGIVCGRDRLRLRLGRSLAPVLRIGDAVEKRLSRIPPQMTQQAGRGIQIARIDQ